MKEWLRLALLLGLLGIMLIVGSILGAALDLQGTYVETAADAHRVSGGNALLLMVAFGGSGLLFLLLRKVELSFLLHPKAHGAFYGWIAVLMLGLFLLLPWLALDEESFRLPASLKAWELKLEAQEAAIEALMRQLIQHGNLFLLTIFMSAAPAVGEELFFRGALQTQLQRLMNPHAAIWLSAIIFSAIHFQVYGFIPRIILGAVMGYLAWSVGSLLPAIWAHFLNNAYATVFAYAGMHWLGHPEWMENSYRPPLALAIVGAGVAWIAWLALRRALKPQ